MKLAKEALDAAVLALLGPKTEADAPAKKEKKEKDKKDKVPPKEKQKEKEKEKPHGEKPAAPPTAAPAAAPTSAPAIAATPLEPPPGGWRSNPEVIGGVPGPTEYRLQAELDARGVKGAKFARVEGEYYSLPLEGRMAKLGAASIHHL
eukprot:1192588-Prorocentrum_minimum.AAC.1